MRRTVLLLAGVLLGIVALGSDSPKEYDDKTEMVGIEGTWQLTGYVFKGVTTKPNVQVVMTCRNEIFSCNYSNGDMLRGSYHIDPACKPPHLDWLPSNGTDKGKRLKFIYQFDGDTLRVAGVFDGEQRPQGFNDHLVFITTYKRMKYASDSCRWLFRVIPLLFACFLQKGAKPCRG